jgi:hypothetical protein
MLSDFVESWNLVTSCNLVADQEASDGLAVSPFHPLAGAVMEAGAKAYALADKICPWVKEAPASRFKVGWLVVVASCQKSPGRMRN